MSFHVKTGWTLQRPLVITRAVSWLVAFVVASGIVAPASLGAVDLRVQGRTELEMGVESAGTQVIVRGRLVDDLGAALRQRTIDIVVVDDRGEQVRRSTTVSRRGGAFRESIELPPGEYVVRTTFEPTEHLAGAEVEEQIELSTQTPRVVLRAPSWVLGTEAEPTLRVGVTVDGVGIEAEPELWVDDRRRETISLGENGRTRVPLADSLSPGNNTLRVVVPSTEYRERAVGETTVRFSPNLNIVSTSEIGFSQFQRVIRIRGRLTDEAGGVSKANLRARLFRSDRSGESVLESETTTDDEGHFTVEFDAGEVSDGTYRATVTAMPDAGTPVDDTVEEMVLDRRLTRWIVDSAAGLAGLVVIVLLGLRGWRRWRVYRQKRRRDERRRRRQERAFETEETLEAVPIEEHSTSERGADAGSDPSRLRAVFWDKWRDEPVEAGRVVIERSGDGDSDGDDDGASRREVELGDGGRVEMELDDGAWRLEVDAPGFMPATQQVRFPHSGEYDGVRFELVAIPLKIRRLFESITSMLSEEDLWGAMPPREIEQLLRASVAANAEDGEDVESAEPTSGAPWDEDVASGVFRRFQRLVQDESGPETKAAYLRALTDILEEAYFSPRTYGRDVWEVARRIGREIRDRAADEAGEGGES